MNIIKEAEIWFMDNGILPSSVKYNLYTKKEVLKHVQSTAILGVGKNRQGNSIGFAIEVILGKGVVYGGILEPCGIATWGKKGLARTVTQNKPLVDVMQDMAQEHRESIEPLKDTTPLKATHQKAQKPIHQQPIKKHIHPSVMSGEYEVEYDDMESSGNSTLYDLLWGLWGVGAISHYFIKDTYNFSGAVFVFIWLLGFIIAITAVILKREKFFSLVHIGFVLIVPFSFVFWLSVLYGLKEPNITANIQPSNNPTTNQVKHQSALTNDEINQILDSAVSAVKPTLPIQVDENTELVNIKADKAMRKLQYIMHANLNSSELSLSEEDFQRIKYSGFLGETKDEFCLENETRIALQKGIELDYLYYAKDGNYMGKINIKRQDCGY